MTIQSQWRCRCQEAGAGSFHLGRWPMIVNLPCASCMGFLQDEASLIPSIWHTTMATGSSLDHLTLVWRREMGWVSLLTVCKTQTRLLPKIQLRSALGQRVWATGLLWGSHHWLFGLKTCQSNHLSKWSRLMFQWCTHCLKCGKFARPTALQSRHSSKTQKTLVELN